MSEPSISERPRREITWAAMCVLLSTLVFAGDLMLPLGVAAAVAHTAVVLLSVVLTRRAGFSLALATLATAYTVGGAVLSPPEDVAPWVVASNRVLSLVTIWVVAVLGLMLARERRRRGLAAEELQHSLERTRSILDTAVDGFISIDERGRIEAANPAAEKMFGYGEQEMLGQNVSMLMPEPWRSEHDGYIRRYLDTGEERIIGIGREVLGRHRDGSTFPIDLAVSEVRMGEERAFIGTVRDLTERKRLEEQFLQSQKMEAVGRLAGGVAHDFNTLLASILGYAEMLLDGLPPEADRAEAAGASDRAAKLRRAAEQIRRSAQRGANLTGQLLTFSRQERRSDSLVDLNRVVAGLGDMLDRLVGERVEIVEELDPELDRVLVDPAQMEQVLVNLVVNAVDAMDGSGRITIATENLRAAGGDGGGGSVMVAVSDTGTGMDAETRRRIFEPFYTTKEKGKGTGLGLSTVYGIVTQGGGTIDVETAPGEGSTFRIALPRAAAPLTEADALAEQHEAVEELPASARGTAEEAVLLVEDDAMFRGLLQEVLDSQGYTVLAASDPKEALELTAARGEPVELVVTDLVMPGMSGDELVRRLRERYPEVRALLMSGYSDEHLEERVRVDGTLPLMRKPFSTKEFARRVRQMLDAGLEG